MLIETRQMVKASEMEEGKMYNYISAITGKRGVGKVYVQIEEGKRVYRYKFKSNGTTEYCTPSAVSKFVEAE